MIPPTYCVERISRLQHREHEPRLSLADTPGRRNGAESPGGQGRQSSRRETHTGVNSVLTSTWVCGRYLRHGRETPKDDG